MREPKNSVSVLGVGKQAVTICTATEQDVTDIVSIVNLAFETQHSVLDGDRTFPGEVQRLMGCGTFLVASRNGQIIGSVHVETSKPSGYFGMLAVVPRHQGRGIGHALREAAEDLCRQCGCREITLTTGDIHEELIENYRRAGYAVVGTESPPSEPHFKRKFDFIRMAKSLKVCPQQ